jgi:hypothetical protein
MTTHRPKMASVLLLLAGLLSGEAARAQTGAPAPPPKLWAVMALGYGSASGTCASCRRGPARMGTTASLSLGTSFSSKMLVGIEADAWTQHADATREVLGSINATVRYYDGPDRGWFVLAGAGLSTYSSWKPLYSGRGWGAMLGAGYAVSSWSPLTLSPLVKLNYGAVGDLHADGVPFANGWKQLVVDAGLQLRWNMMRGRRAL